MKRISLILLFLSPLLHASDWQHRLGADLGYTNNANFESTNQDSDFYYVVGYSFFNFREDISWLGRIRYQDYFNQSQNDLLTCRLGPSLSLGGLRNFGGEWNLAIGGQHFNQGAPGFTEESFNFVYADTSLSLDREASPSLAWSIEPGLQVRNFLEFSSRRDAIIYADARMDWMPAKSHAIAPALGFGIVKSNDPLYSRRYIDLGVEWTYEMKPDLRLVSGISRRSTTFTNRFISDTTAISRGRGRLILGSSRLLESHNFSRVDVSLFKKSGATEFALNVNATTQTSKSQIEEYDEMGIMGSITQQF